MIRGAKSNKKRIFVGDFETTVYKGQENTEVWAAASVEIGTEDVKIFHSIEEMYHYYVSLKCSVIVYFHNLKFDGAFWLYYIMSVLHYKQALTEDSDGTEYIDFEKDRLMKNKTFKYLISDMGQWYSITIKINGHTIQLRDSLKLLPFSVKQIGKGFKTKHQKLEMEYTGFRYAGCNITDEEKRYIANDVLVVKEALELMFNEGHDKLTIGACCLSEYKKMYYGEYERMFPNLYDIEIDGRQHGVNNAGDWIRKSYRGGWCYLVKGKEGQIKENGFTADVNSLYPSMMPSESGNYYPIGKPTFWTGNYIPEEAKEKERFYFVRIRTRFYIKPGRLPFVQIKRSSLYRGTESLETSDYYSAKDGKYYKTVRIGDMIIDTRQELTLTMMDYKLLLEQYDLEDFEIVDGCYFYAMQGIFDNYINVYKKKKIEAETGAQRTIAKLFLNNLYGKMASSQNLSFKYAVELEDTTTGFITVPEYKKQPGYIACGTAITSYARNFTIRAAQANYYGADKPGFVYADTDSIHCDMSPDKVKGIVTDDKAFCCWKLESYWDKAIFTRQKTYIEHVTHEDGKPIEKPYHNIKCAGMPQRCKNLFELSMNGSADPDGYITEAGNHKEWSEDEKYFLFNDDGTLKIRTYDDFKIGLCVPGKLIPHRIPGGILLIETTYEMR